MIDYRFYAKNIFSLVTKRMSSLVLVRLSRQKKFNFFVQQKRNSEASFVPQHNGYFQLPSTYTPLIASNFSTSLHLEGTFLKFVFPCHSQDHESHLKTFSSFSLSKVSPSKTIFPPSSLSLSKFFFEYTGLTFANDRIIIARISSTNNISLSIFIRVSLQQGLFFLDLIFVTTETGLVVLVPFSITFKTRFLFVYIFCITLGAFLYP